MLNVGRQSFNILNVEKTMPDALISEERNKTHMKGSSSELSDGSKAVSHLVSVFSGWFSLAVKY